MSSESARVRRTRAAVTRIVRAEHFGRMLTLAQVAIHTGRTHQIRVHLSAIGHPIVGDALYGGVHRRVPGDLRAVTHLDRPFLHAAHLVFQHPDDGRQDGVHQRAARGSAEGARRAAREVRSGDARRPVEIVRFQRADFRFMQTVYKGRVFSVEVGKRRFPNGQEHDVEIVRHSPVGRADPGRRRWPRGDRQAVPGAARSRDVGVSGGAARTRASRRKTPRAASARKRSAACRTGSSGSRGLYPAPGFCDEELIFFRVSDLRAAAAGLAAQAGRRTKTSRTRIGHRRRGARDAGARRDRRSEDRLRADADLRRVSG